MTTIDHDEEVRDTVRSSILSGRGAFRHLLQEELNESPFVRPPHTITWSPPNGHVIQHSSLEDAQRMAENYAGKHPGEVVAVYQLVGFAHVAFKPAPFTMTTEEPQMIEISLSQVIHVSSRGMMMSEPTGVKVPEKTTVDAWRAIASKHEKEIERLQTALQDILAVAETGEIPDRWGRKYGACDTTCLSDIKETARRALHVDQ